MLERAATLEVDEVVVDLEDSVAAADKPAAREQLGSARARHTLAVRINGVGTLWWRDDLDAVRALAPDVVVVPKVESADAVRAVAEQLPPGIGIEAQVETARGLVEVERIAAVGPPLEALVFGPGDFAASIGVPVLTIGAGPSEYALARIVVAARAFGLQAVDGPFAMLDDAEALRASAARAVAHGYDGKWVIHPSQIEPVNRIFTPSPTDLERAKRLLEAATQAVRFEGELVDEASRKLAEALLRRAELLA